MAKTQAVTILFCDLVASTERRARMGDDAFDEFSARLFVALRNAIRRAGGREVSNAGDGMMIAFPESVAAAASCAIEMHEKVAELDADDPPQLRIGISCGEVAQDGDNYSGMPIVEAARLESAAAPGQTLANAVVPALIGNRRALVFRDVGPLTLKGIPQPLATVELLRTADTDPPAPPRVAPAESDPRRRARNRTALIGAAIGVVAIVAIIAVVRGGSGKTNASPAVTPTTIARNYPVTYAAIKCPADDATRIRGLKCGLLTVPEDRSKPHGRAVKLQVYRAPARVKATKDPVVDFGADDLASSPARDYSDEIQMAQRGWGGAPGSNPVLTCPEFSKIAPAILTKPSGDQAEQQLQVTALSACHDRYTKAGVNLSKYDLLTVGDDFVDLVRALHLTRVNLVSGYIATISALEVDRQMPGVVRSMTLQEPVPGGRSGYTDPTGYLSDAFNSYVALCRADAACKAAYPNLPASLVHDWNTYREHPRLATGEDKDGHKWPVLIDGGRVGLAISGGLQDRDSHNLLAAGIAAKDRSGEVDQLTAGRIIVYDAPYFDPTFAWGADLSVACSYEQYTVDSGSALSSKLAPALSGVDDGFLRWACKAWRVNKIGAVAFDDPSTSVPTLVVSGDLSPGSDQGWPDTFQQSLPNATVATFPTMNSNVLGINNPRCLANLRRQFLETPTADLDKTAQDCGSQSPKIHFVASPTS